MWRLNWLRQIFRWLRKPEPRGPLYPGGLGLAAFDVAASELGAGEEGSNNMGPELDRFRSCDGTGKGLTKGSWCASFVSYCYMVAAVKKAIALPFTTSRGAKRLVNNIIKAGERVPCTRMSVHEDQLLQWIKDHMHEHPMRGDVICWDRGGWKGHVGIVDDYRVDTDELWTIEGNRGEFPAKVGRFRYTSRQWRKKLYKVGRV